MALALISVHDKTGLAGFAKRLAACGWSFLASGGTARALSAAGIAVTEVAAYTGSPEILGGRVKTLHPAIHGGILSRGTESDRAELAALGWAEIDLVVANLYPFEATMAKSGITEIECVEEIDIGGVALLRAAAKNFARVGVVCEPVDYDRVAEAVETGSVPPPSGSVPVELRRELSCKAFAVCARYDAAIASWIAPDSAAMLYGFAGQTLRYGENPHQKARLYTDLPGAGPLGGKVLQGKELSYNNILDLDAAWRIAASFNGTAAVVVKHLSPCGIAVLGDDTPDALAFALASALECDPVSAFGGVIAVNRPFGADAARALEDTFVECIAAPTFTDEARALLARRKNARLLELGCHAPESAGSQVKAAELETRSVRGGFLRQDIDRGDPEGTEWRVVSKRQPTEAEMAALRFAWKACVSAKSNAILLAAPVAGQATGSAGMAGFSTVGIGSGQPNRVDSTRIAVTRA
ncbi:MAG: bifunctional phosphoribosylaminoimidazolecarboxamide formyltransferase/IMP cyclohydrolase PurH, partial [Spirochaetae bacterium HGW-Spirochaetae-7]